MKIIRLNKKENNYISYIYESPIGNLILSTSNDYRCITLLDFYSNDNRYNIVKYEEPTIIKKTKKELDNYFSTSSFCKNQFTIPVALYGTDFQYSVWIETSKIPFGNVVAYSDIAKSISNSKNISRAVGLAESKNQIIIIIPCHRVVSFNKKLTGYSGGIDKKEYLLKHEGFDIKYYKIVNI